MMSSETASSLDSESGARATRLGRALRAQGRVIGALMLRDMRTRFGRSHLTFLLALGWPLAHMFAIFFSFVLVARYVPLGGSAGVFIATGTAPYILCLYPGRMVSLAIVQNFPLLMFPVVKTTDIVIARVAVEVMAALIVISIFIAILLAFDYEIIPPNIAEGVAAVLASIYLGVGFGVMNVVLVAIFRFWFFLFLGFMALMYVTSGVSMVQVSLSDNARYALAFNPMLHLVTWLRTAYYGEYAPIPLSKAYVLGCATVSFLLGMAGDRLLRGRIVMPP